MAKPKHRKFRASEFIDVFAGRCALLRDFARSFDGSRFPDESAFTLQAFQELIAEAVTSDPGMIEHLYRAYDFSKDPGGHELLCEVIAEKGWQVDNTLPVQCLAIWLHNQDQSVFNFAYDRMHFSHVEKVTLYRTEPPEAFDYGNGHLDGFAETLKERFTSGKGSSNVLVRQYAENDSLNIIVYHEKRTQAHLVFNDRESTVGPVMLRPAKQDFLSFNYATGELQIDASYSKEKAALRTAFASKYLGNAVAFESAESTRVLDLDVLTAPEFSLPVSQPWHCAKLVEIKFSMEAAASPTFMIRSKDVLATLQDTGLRAQIEGASVASAKIRLCLGESRADRKTVELKASNALAFNSSTHKDTVENYLRQWGILLARNTTQILA